jgi:hypothetical protein
LENHSAEIKEVQEVKKEVELLVKDLEVPNYFL